MSRGLGKTQRAVLDMLQRHADANAASEKAFTPRDDSDYWLPPHPSPSTRDIATEVYGVSAPSESQLVAVRRALRGMWRQRVVRPDGRRWGQRGVADLSETWVML
ncbi:hypothetical protein [Hyphomicrobium sp. 1Nfss2.1]|uniref:hypothetical protein n=1 Tax=Hyphomicrobium sp. 1Nfss2.1 TaxID=3413936 RepID=UPI003C7E7BD8